MSFAPDFKKIVFLYNFPSNFIFFVKIMFLNKIIQSYFLLTEDTRFIEKNTKTFRIS